MPIPWQKDQNVGKIEKNLSLFLAQTTWTARVSGDISQGYKLMNEFKQTDLRKRDSKAMYKQLESTSNQAEKSKEIKRIRFEVRDEYIKACIRCPIDPKIWINDIYPKEEHEVVHTLMIGGMF